MKRFKTAFLLMSLLALTACRNDSFLSNSSMPSKAWSLTVFSPPYMQGWVEQVVAEDLEGRRSVGPRGGLGSGDEHFEQEAARGWNRDVGWDVYTMSGAGLPKRIYVRWQSIIEQKTYKGWIEIPEEARSIMYNSVRRKCTQFPGRPLNTLAAINVGVAPGGVIGVWVDDHCILPHKIARAQAEIEPLGPDQGQNQGRYAYPIDENAKRYVERWGIPYGSW